MILVRYALPQVPLLRRRKYPGLVRMLAETRLGWLSLDYVLDTLSNEGRYHR